MVLLAGPRIGHRQPCAVECGRGSLVAGYSRDGDWSIFCRSRGTKREFRSFSEPAMRWAMNQAKVRNRLPRRSATSALSPATCTPERDFAAHSPLAVPLFLTHQAVALTRQLGLLGDVELNRLPQCVRGGSPDILVWVGLGQQSARPVTDRRCKQSGQAARLLDGCCLQTTCRLIQFRQRHGAHGRGAGP